MSYRLGFVMEQTWGHVTHQRNLAAQVARDPDVEASWLPVPFRADDLWSRLPLVRDNWSLRGGLRARAAVLRRLRAGPLDGLLFHTQILALCAPPLLRRYPAIVSLDATPLNMDAVGRGYGHRPDGRGLGAWVKRAWNSLVVRSAAALAPWSEWVRQSLIHDYGADPERIAVIPPGVDTKAWRPAAGAPVGGAGRRPRLLFVGGDFARKGGHDVVAVVRDLDGRCELDCVTNDPAAVEGPNVRVHRGLTPNDGTLRRLYRNADALVLPTRGDCMPLVVLEAMASGLPVIATRVGAIPEQVDHGGTGLLVAPGDRRALATAVRALLDAPDRRRALGRAGRARAVRQFDAARNYACLLGLFKALVDAQRDQHEHEVRRAA